MPIVTIGGAKKVELVFGDIAVIRTLEDAKGLMLDMKDGERSESSS